MHQDDKIFIAGHRGLVGSAIVMYDGAPLDLWSLAAENGVTYMGVGAPYITASAKEGRRPGEEHDLSGLRGIGSTGSPLPPEGFAWELLVTGPKWFDTRAGEGGGGGIDLVMHLLGLDFVKSVKLLASVGAPGQRQPERQG